MADLILGTNGRAMRVREPSSGLTRLIQRSGSKIVG